MPETVSIEPRDKLSYLLKYRQWSSYIMGALIAMIVITMGVVIMELTTGQVLKFAEPALMTSILASSLLAITLGWSLFTEYRIYTTRKQLVVTEFPETPLESE